ncbi:Panacea domain-containing protein [Rummeliibacillus stabekisii]|uniref:Panacea domain-containing protein n=1 Tax=Rummeliibacillus stabekisii TaxID=241244 RepID=UPI001169227D|nr:type II toxin-antitoxin system antitoxin SocA domain-containing protein [Rummeliibacillus stabekisii]MBB5171623.1 putative phage-associated protein [Rummeliibacillus stabekisii]GEL05469.1 hypothetical protein RST01_20960 [Rummeliibacillus stabekisii]
MTYPVNQIANYIIELAHSKKHPVNNLKLQKILYFLEARFLLEKGESLFNESIEKWKYGPVVPEVYFRFNHLGAESIKQVPQVFDFNLLLQDDFEIKNLNSDTNYNFDSEDKDIIDTTILKLLPIGPFDLVEETHKHNSWLKDERRILSGERHIEYTTQEIANDFENKRFRIWENNE